MSNLIKIFTPLSFMSNSISISIFNGFKKLFFNFNKARSTSWHIFSPILFVICLFSCSPNDVKIPDNVLPKDKMILLLADVQITEAAMLLQNSKGNISENRAPDYYQFIFKKHNITEKQFRESFTFYIGQVELMDKIYEEVITEISKRQAEVANK